MKIDLTQNLYNANGEKLTISNDAGKQEAPQLGVLLKNIALTELEKEETNKAKDFDIFMKLNEAKKEIDLTNEELVRLQNKLPKIYGILIYGQINSILEGKNNPLKPKE